MKKRIALAGVCLLVMMSVWTACDRPSPSHPAPEPGKPLLVFERLGGIAGFQDKLLIGYGGEYYLSLNGREHIGLLSAELRAQLAGWIEGFAPFVIKLEDNPGGPDNLVRRVEWAGLGHLQASRSQQEEILGWAASLMHKLGVAED
jgi:hypothetical protein